MKKALIITFAVIVCLGGLTGFFIGAASRFALFELFISLAPTAPLFPESNILLLGVDDAFGQRSDTIMVLHVGPEKKEASVVSIPRDTLVVLPERGLDKINHAFAYGGAELSRRTVEELLHVQIPYYLTLNLAGIENLIDEIGGIEINVEKRMYYTDYSQDLYIDLKPGLQKLSGKDTMGYLRFRHDDGDFARIARQQKFLKALAAEMIKKDNILRSPGLFLSLLSYVDTNLNSRQVMGLCLGLRGAYELGQVYMTTIPGSDLMVDGIYYWKPDEPAIQRIVEQFILGKRLASSG
ncbi:LCP family protein [Candidatus Saganbacteria bacterium]|uniref:LCP family protein n=1 Tax=Candidatus Saganbacteria bacterium TaxID=2575572 RepID=A0A9D6YVY3_UNCSA|nr:LCP family protein [Candidatus Saganbacteria bacterium]